MSNSVRVRVSGEFACFSRPECKVERVSYEVMTPSAARGVLDAILWKPEFRWNIRRIKVLKPIRFIALKRNEIQSKVVPSAVQAWARHPADYEPQAAGAGSSEATPRNTLALRDGAWIIEAEPLLFDATGDNTPMKYVSMFQRRVEKGQCFTQPSLGCREFPARFEPPIEGEEAIGETRDLGMMLYDIIFPGLRKGPHRPVFFPARLESGVLDTRVEQVLAEEGVRKEVLACSYRR
ncbi:MAG: type I-C CRISPR-associated protein Cas5 [Candidatus Riflebacteria bacterium]|nr:type I-C CRISPR-associated protein Cas5 [Candidatus Riflebacteria bacterium]